MVNTYTGRHLGYMQVALLCISTMLVASGCSRQLMPTPNLYVQAGIDPFKDVPAELQGNMVDVMYVTDRSPIEQSDGSVKYGFGRSMSLAFGSCVVEIGKDVTWDQLVSQSRTDKRSIPLPMSVHKIEEHGRFAEYPLPLVKEGDKVMVDPKVQASQAALADEFRKEFDARLALTPHKEAYVFIHGFNNNFNDSVIVMAEMWHFLGRRGVPIAYSWPAGAGASISGYNEDYESSEFTVYHFKRFLDALSTYPELEKIHVIAHSRGTNVATDGLRELVIEIAAGGQNPRTKLKIANMILAAPDLDYQVASMRLGGDKAYLGIERLTIYVSKYDGAIGLSEWIFGGDIRVGTLRPDELSPTALANAKVVPWIQFVDARIRRVGFGHSYYRLSPAVSSDIILLLRDNLSPGASNGRPLHHITAQYWALGDDYPELSKPAED